MGLFAVAWPNNFVTNNPRVGWPTKKKPNVGRPDVVDYTK